MQETMIIRPNKESDRLTLRTLKVMKEVQKRLGDRTERVDYKAIATVLGLKWNNVKYAVNTLVKAGFLAKEDGKLTVLKKVVL